MMGRETIPHHESATPTWRRGFKYEQSGSFDVDLPPPTYALLVGTTLLALPILIRRASDNAARLLVWQILLGFALVELGLVVLYYSRLACWTLAAAGTVLLGAAAYPRRPMLGGIAAAPVAIAAGLLFQFTPGEAAFANYFAIGLPVAVGLPLAALQARWLRWDASHRTVLASVGLLLFGGFIAVSAFSIDFLTRFEVAHLPVLAASLASLLWLAGHGRDRVRRERHVAIDAMNPGEYAGRPASPANRLAFGLTNAALLVGVAGHALSASAYPGLAVRSWIGLGAAGLAVAFLVVGRATQRRVQDLGLAASLAALAAAVTVPLAAIRHEYLGPGDKNLFLPLAAAGISTALALTAFSAALAAMIDARRRARLGPTTDEEAPGALRRETNGPVRVADLEDLASEVRAANARVGVLVVNAPQTQPLWTLPDDVYRWLEERNDPAARVHVAIRESDATYLVPPLVPEELDE